MKLTAAQRSDLVTASALLLPLLARLHADAPAAATQRLLLLALALVTVHAWAYVFARAARRPPGQGLPAFALVFVLMLPGPVGWGGALLAISFGALFGREAFGGRPILPPALVALAFAVFAFPDAGFEARGGLDAPPDAVWVLACVAAAAILVWRGSLAWQVAASAVAGAVVAGLLLDGAQGWRHPGLGTFAAGVAFLAAAPDSAAAGSAARWVHGLLVGALAVVIRLFHPDQPDGVVFAALLGALFAPLVERALAWRPRRG